MATSNLVSLDNMPEAIRQNLEQITLYSPYESLPAMMFAYESTLELNSGRSKTFVRFNQLDSTPQAIPYSGRGEPAPVSADRDFVTADVLHYGITVLINSYTVLYDSYDVVANIGQRVGEAKVRMENALIMDLLNSATSLHVCEGGTNNDEPTEISSSDLLAVAVGHKRNNAPTFLHSLPGTNADGTTPIPESYVLIAPEEIRTSLYNIADFTPAHQYGFNGRLGEMEVGALRYHRVFCTNSARVEPNASSSSNRSVGTCISFGQDAYARIRSDGASGSVVIRKDTTSYHQMNWVLTCSFGFASAILADFAITKVRCSL